MWEVGRLSKVEMGTGRWPLRHTLEELGSEAGAVVGRRVVSEYGEELDAVLEALDCVWVACRE